MSQDLGISSQLQQLIVVISQIVKLRDQKQQQNHKNRLKLLITLNNILSENKNIKIEDASIQIAPIINPSLQHSQDIASFLYNILFIFITQTLEQQAKVVDVSGFKNLHLIFSNIKIMQFFEKDVVFSASQLNVDDRDKFIDGLQWIIYKAFSQLKNNIYYAALNNVMCEISKKQEIFIYFNFNLVSDCFLFISDVAFNLNKHKLITLLIKIFKQIQTITQNSEKFKQFSKNISVNTHKQLKSYIETIIKQIQRDVSLAGSLRELLNKLKQQIELTLNAMGLNLLSNQSIEKRLIGLRMMYHDIINEQIYFQWIKSKNVFQLILKETSHNAFVDSSGFIFKLVIRNLKNNKSYLNKILQYINNSTPQIRKSVLKHIQHSSIFQHVSLYGQILQKLLTNQNPEFYTSQLVDLIYRLLPKASYHHNSIIIQKLIKVYLQLSKLKNQKKYVIGRCKDLINSSLVRNLQKKTLSSEEENQKFNTVFSIYEFLLSEPLNIEKICLSNSITKKIIQKFSITREQKQRIIQYLLKQKKIIENSMRWITEWSDGRLKQEIQNFFCTLMEDLALKTKNSLIQNTQILIEATGSIKIFKKLIVMFQGKLEYLKDNFSHFIQRAYLKNYPSTFICISFYFFYINQTKINYNSKLIDINCEPSELIGIDVLKTALMSSEISISRDEIAQFISNLYTNYSDVVKDKCQKYLQSTFTQISQSFSNMWFLSSAEEKINEMLGYLALVYYLMVATQYCGVGLHKSFNQLVPINYVTVIAKNQAKKSTQLLIFEARLPSNMLFFDTLVLICYQFDYDISSVQIRYGNKVLDKKWNSLSLEQMQIDGQVLFVSNTKQNFLMNKSRRERILLDNKQLSPKALQALTQLYNIFCPSGKMTEIQCIQFIKGVTRSAYVSKTDTRIKKFMQQYDQDKDGIVNLQDFIRFYHDRADENSQGDIWVNLKNMGYRYDLKKYKSPVDPLPDRLMLRTYLAQEQEIYDTLFQMLKVGHDQLKTRTIKILRRLPQYKSFLDKFEQNFQISSKQIFQIEYYLILVQKGISQKGGVQKAQQFFLNKRTEIIFQIMSNFLAKQSNSLDDKKCLFLSIKILRSLCSIQKLVYRPNYIIYSSELYLSHLKNLNYEMFIKKLNECLKQKNIQQIECMFTLLLQQNLIKREKNIKKLGLDEALMSIFNNIQQIRQIACNFIYFMSINKEINETPQFKLKINSFFHIDVQNNSNIWFETLINILSANQYYIDFDQVINRCLNQLMDRKQSLQNPYDEIIEGYLFLLYTIKVKRDIQLSFQRLVNIAENVFFCRSRKVIYHILSLIDYDKAIFYVKQLILNAKKGTQKQIIPKNYYVGFNNLGSTCYINSILQLFFSIKRFRDQIITMNINNQIQQFNKCADQGQQLLDEIIKLCVYLQYGHNKFYDMTKFCQLYKNKNYQPIDVKKQEDAHEFYGLFLEVMEVYFQKSMKKDIFEKLFTGQTAYKYICTQCQYQKIIKQKFSCLTLQIQDHRTLEDSLDNFTKRQQIQDYECENCSKKVKVRKQTNFWDVPEYLTISLKRIFFDFSKYKNVKISSKLQFPQNLDLKKYAFSQQMTLNDEYLYELKSVVIHSGSCLSGHYYSIIKMKQKWYKFDDQNVSQYNIKNLENEGYGKDEQQENYVDEEYPRSKNAYILCYKKTKIKQKELKQCHPSSELMQIVQQQKLFMIEKLKIYNDSAFQFCIELFQVLKTPILQQNNQLYNKQWKNDENCQKYIQIFQLAVTLQNFLQSYWKLSNTSLIPNLSLLICCLFYLIPQKTYDFISKLKTNELAQMLCYHQSNEVKQMYKHILTKGVYIFYQYYKFNFQSEDQVAKHFSGIVFQLLLKFEDENFYEYALKLQMFFQFWKIMLDCVQNLQNLLLRSNLLAYLLKIIVSDSQSKQNGSHVDDSVAQKQKSVPESIGKRVCSLIFSILKKKNAQIHKYTPTFGKKISIDLQINQKQYIMLTNAEFYSNILRYNQDRQKVISQTLTHLAFQKEQFSKQISKVLLKGLKIYEKKSQIFFTMIDYIKNFLKIKDGLRQNRLKWILGIWQLQMGHDYQFGFSKKDINSNLYRYVSNLYISQTNKYPPILQFLIEYNSIQQKIAVFLSVFILELIMDDDIALIFLKKTPSPTCIYKNYFDWLQTLKQKLGQIQQINFPIDKPTFIQKFMSLYNDLKQKIQNDKETQQLEKPVHPFIIGRNNKLTKIKQDQFVKYKLTLYSHETYILENLPTGKGNISIPPNFFTKPQSRYFLSKYEKYNQVNNKNYKHLVQKKQTMLTLQIQSEYDLRIEFNLTDFNEQIYTITGRSTINFSYQNLQQERWNNFLTVDVIQQIQAQRNRKFSEEIKMQLNQAPLKYIIEDNRSKHCSRCTLLNQIQAKQCEACSLEFY